MLPVLALSGALILPGFAPESEDDLPTSPEGTRPLSVGATIPGLTLATIDGLPFDLMEAVTAQPTVLVYYRGGW